MGDGRHRVAFIGGPWHGRVDLMRVPLSMTLEAVEGPSLDELYDGDPDDAVPYTSTSYRFHRFHDLDGTEIYLGVAKGHREDPPVTVFGLLRELGTLRDDNRRLADRAANAETMASRALRRSDELAGLLREARERATLERQDETP